MCGGKCCVTSVHTARRRTPRCTVVAQPHLIIIIPIILILLPSPIHTQNAAVNKKGNIVGEFAPTVDQVSEDRLQPYSEVFGLQRFRECELIHGRWAMLGALGALVGEASTGVTWWEAGKVELDGARYLDFNLPFTVSQLVIIEVLLVGGAELYRNSELDPEKRIYPGGLFDPLNLASGDDPERIFKLKEAELKHGRLAMVAFLGYSVQAGFTREGVLGSLAKFANSF